VEKDRREAYLEMLDTVAGKLGIEKMEAPSDFDPVEWLKDQRRNGLSNPIQQVFQTEANLYDKEGNRYRFSFPEPYAEAVQIACEEGYFGVVFAYLASSCPPFALSDRQRLQLTLLSTIVDQHKVLCPTFLSDGEALAKKTYTRYIKPLSKVASTFIEGRYPAIKKRTAKGKGKPKDLKFEAV